MSHMYYDANFNVTGQKCLTSHQHYQPLGIWNTQGCSAINTTSNNSVPSGVVVAVKDARSLKVSESWLTSVHSTTHSTERSYTYLSFPSLSFIIFHYLTMNAVCATEYSARIRNGTYMNHVRGEIQRLLLCDHIFRKRKRYPVCARVASLQTPWVCRSLQGMKA